MAAHVSTEQREREDGVSCVREGVAQKKMESERWGEIKGETEKIENE